MTLTSKFKLNKTLLGLLISASVLPFFVIIRYPRRSPLNETQDPWIFHGRREHEEKGVHPPARFGRDSYNNGERSVLRHPSFSHQLERRTDAAASHKNSTNIFNQAYQWLVGTSNDGPNSLQSPLDGDESGYGIMFEIETKTSGPGIIVQSLGLHIGTVASQMVTVYTLEGSFQGKEHDRTQWQRLLSSSVEGSGKGHPTELNPSDFTSVKMDPGVTRSFYVVMKSPGLVYTVGKQYNDVIAQDSNLQLRVGKGISLIFGDIIGNRAFNGVIHYELLKIQSKEVFDGGLASTLGKPLQLTTPLNGGNYAFGIMFDVIVLKDMKLLSIDLHLPANITVTANVYTLTGTHLGNEINPDAWFLVCSAPVTGKGLGALTPLPADKFYKLALKAGSRQAFYATVNAAVMQYSDGSEVNRMYIRNNELQILEGTAVARPFFGGTFAPRIFNGAMRYQLVGEAPEIVAGREYGGKDTTPTSHVMGQLSALMLGVGGNSGSYGIMFDIVADQQVYIAGIDIHTSVLNEAVTATLFTKDGSHVGFELDRGDNTTTAWKLDQRIQVAGFGQGRLTPFPDLVKPLYVDAGKTKAFFVILQTAELRYDTPTDTNLKQGLDLPIDAYDQNIKVLRGTGIGEGHQYFPSRIVNGAIRYLPMIGFVS
jgi:hypothetical protein